MKRTGICLIAGLLLAALPLVMNAEKVPFYYGHSRELHASVYHQKENSGMQEGDMYFLSWDENVDAVGYELEIAEEEGAWDEEQPSGKAVYHVPKVYVPGIMIPSSFLSLKAETKDRLYWRVRPFDLDGKPAGPFSAPRRLEGSLVPIHRYAPLPRPYDEGEKGGALLYPVYSYIGIPGADSYEVEVTAGIRKMKMDMPLPGIVSMQGSLRLLISMTRHPGRERITGGCGDWTGKAIR